MRCILNLARPDVQEYLLERLDPLLANHNNVSEPGWPGAPGDQRERRVRYVQGLYHLWGSLRERHPQVIWQSCSGGGPAARYRIDGQARAHTGRAWMHTGLEQGEFESRMLRISRVE